MGEESEKLSAMQRNKVRRASIPKEHAPDGEAGELNVVAVDRGFIVSAFGQRVGEQCQGAGAGVTVGLAGDEYDYDGLTACAKRLKNEVPEASEETSATITANKNIPYEIVIGTIDAIRKADDGQELFPDITFGVPK
jgi:hypothetical protein